MKKIYITLTIGVSLAFGFYINTIFVYAQTTIQHRYHIDKNFNVIPNDPKDNKKVVLLTIDDGPSKSSYAIVDILRKHNIKAIFFVNGMHEKPNKGSIAMEYTAGQTIGNHTWSHANLSKVSEATVKNEIDTDTTLITKETGQAPRFFRPPYGVGTKYVRDYVKKQNMVYINWSGAAKDWEKSAHDQKVYIGNVTKDIHSGDIILIHEHDWSVPYVDTLISTLQRLGYTFVDPALIN